MWQRTLTPHATETDLVDPGVLITARAHMKEHTGSKYTEAALIVARRMLHDYDLVPHLQTGSTRSRAYFLLLELIAEFPILQQCLAAPHVRTLHLDVGPGGFIDAVLKKAPKADWHATSSTEVYEHIRNAKKNNGHARLLHHSIAHEVGEPQLITMQGSLENLTLALQILHPQGILVAQCDNPYSEVVTVCAAKFQHVVVCKPRLLAPSAPDFIVLAWHPGPAAVPLQPMGVVDALARMELQGIQQAANLAFYLTQIDVKSYADTQTLYFDHIATNASRMEKVHRVLEQITC